MKKTQKTKISLTEANQAKPHKNKQQYKTKTFTSGRLMRDILFSYKMRIHITVLREKEQHKSAPKDIRGKLRQ